MAKQQKIIPHLWFDHNAEEAVKFYAAVFKRSKIGEITRYTDAGKEVHGMEAGTVLTVEFEIEGYHMMALNGGPVFKFNPSISFTVHCPAVEEVDELWKKLSEGGKALMGIDKYFWSERYGWVQDKFGVSWQLNHRPGIKEKKVVPSLMYTGEMAGRAEEAMKYYTSIFRDSKVGDIFRYDGKEGSDHDKAGTVAHGEFKLSGQDFIAMDSAYPHGFFFNEAISLLVLCKDQKEIDYFWEKFEVKPGEGQCGWLKDKFGVSWQIAPEGMGEILNNPDKEKADRGMNAMLQMKKIDIAALKKAVEGK